MKQATAEEEADGEEEREAQREEQNWRLSSENLGPSVS